MFSMILNFQRTLFLFVILCSSLIFALQSQEISYTLKKGEVLDMLLATNKPTGKEAFKKYRTKAFPIAVEMGYSFLPGFTIKETLQGALKPGGVIFGKWRGLSERQEFLKVIGTRVPDFHQMRKDIWSYFSVTYYEMDQDISFSMNPEKLIVATNYWQKDDKATQFEGYIEELKNLVQVHGGNIKLALEKGYSPHGYYYHPDYTILSQWENREDFDRFVEKSKQIDSSFLQTINQFVLTK